jgi:GntR family transcriptional regulator
VFGLDPAAPATRVARVLLMDGEPGAWMRDIVHPDVKLPAPPRIRQLLERGQMVLDVLRKEGVPVAYTRAHITARVLTRRDRVGKALGVNETVAALEIEHVTCTAEGTPVEHSTDIFLRRSLDLHVMRWLEDAPPVPAIGRGR